MDAAMPFASAAEGLSRPAMWLTRTADLMRLERVKTGGWSEEEIAAHVDTMRSAFTRMRTPARFIELPGLFHIGFTDIAAYSPLPWRPGLLGETEPRAAHRMIADFTRAFFDRMLRGLLSTEIDAVAARYPGVRLDYRDPER
jgi:hypothetical protein